jgi:deferrochelatase/peroxidase EfeB
MADVSNLQAIIGRSSAKPFFAVLLFAIDDAKRAKGFLRTWGPEIPVGLAAEQSGVAALHLLFSWSGMEKLLKGRTDLNVDEGRRAFDTFFVDPAQAPDRPALAQQFGFIGNSAPDTWWDKFKTSDVELVVYGAFDDEVQRDNYVQRLRTTASNCGLSELQLSSFSGGAMAGYRPPGGRLHFGYRDGITTLDVDWTDSRRPGSVDLRQVIVGYPNDDYPTAPFQPGPWRDFSREGSYACLSWVTQDVVGFEAYLEKNAPKVAPLAAGADPKEWLAARLLGRWRDGSALILHDKQQPEPPDLNDAFGYNEDPTGLKCPLTAHIRVVNSRDQPLKFANQIRFPGGPPRLVRRGFSFGEPWQGPADDNERRGIVGLFFCGRVNEQFYTVLRWMHRTDFSDVFKGVQNGIDAQDALAADHIDPASNTAIHLTSEHADGVDIGLSPFVSYKGVAVLFAPGIQALATLTRDVDAT